MYKKIAAVFMAILIPLSLSACKKEEKSPYGFETKICVEEREDGWYYVSELSFNEDENGKEIKDSGYHYGYDAYNLKYQQIDNYYLRIYDEETGEEVGSSTTVLPYKSLLPEGGRDYDRISDCFNKKCLSSPLKKM